jgi:hypothetical protein
VKKSGKFEREELSKWILVEETNPIEKKREN